MKNDYCNAPNEPRDFCLMHEGQSDCPKWPDRLIPACCWLSCEELCGAACMKKDIGIRCEYYYGGGYFEGIGKKR